LYKVVNRIIIVLVFLIFIRNDWVLPETRLMDHILDEIGYTDAKTSNASGTRDDGGRVLTAGTSRFDTRIDWILLPPDVTTSVPTNANAQTCNFKLSFEKESYSVIDASDVTDHNMVISTIILTVVTEC
jgi:hypothetical protein